MVQIITPLYFLVTAQPHSALGGIPR